jgi:hypothetical protein
MWYNWKETSAEDFFAALTELIKECNGCEVYIETE